MTGPMRMPRGIDPASEAASALNIVKDMKRDYGATLSPATTSGTATSGSAIFPVSSAEDFQNGNAVRVGYYGPATSLTTPTGLTATAEGTTGSTSITYAVAFRDEYGGITAVATITVANANATLSQTNYVQVSWSAPPTGTVSALVWRTATNGTSPTTTGYIGEWSVEGTLTNQFNDFGMAVVEPPFGVPASAPTEPVGQVVLTTIKGGGGTTTLTLATDASQTASDCQIIHDDCNAWSTMLNEAASLAADGYNLTVEMSEGTSIVGNFGNGLYGGATNDFLSIAGLANFTLRGRPGGLSLIQYLAPQQMGIVLHTSVGNVHVKDLSFGFTSPLTSRTNTLDGINILAEGTSSAPAQNVSIEGCDVDDSPAGGVGMYLYYCNHVRMIENFTQNTFADGVTLQAQGAYSSDILIQGNTVKCNGDDAISVDNNITDTTLASNFTDVSILDNIVENAGAHGIFVGGVNNGLVAGNNVDGSLAGSVGIGEQSGANYSQNVKVQGNLLANAGTAATNQARFNRTVSNAHGVQAFPGRYMGAIEVSDNTIISPAADGVNSNTGIDVKGNRILNPGGHGVYVNTSSSAGAPFISVIQGNRVVESGEHGIYALTANVAGDHITVKGNVLTNCVSLSIGTPTPALYASGQGANPGTGTVNVEDNVVYENRTSITTSIVPAFYELGGSASYMRRNAVRNMSGIAIPEFSGANNAPTKSTLTITSGTAFQNTNVEDLDIFLPVYITRTPTTLSSGLTAGTTYTSLSVAALPNAIPNTSVLQLQGGQLVVTDAGASAGATSISVASFTAVTTLASGASLQVPGTVQVGYGGNSGGAGAVYTELVDIFTTASLPKIIRLRLPSGYWATFTGTGVTFGTAQTLQQ